MQLLSKIARSFIFGNVFVAFCAYFLATEELYFLGETKLINPISLFIFFSTLLIYNYRKLFFAKTELLPATTMRSQWDIANRSFLAIICISAVYGMLISAFSLSIKTLFFLFPLFFISVLYATPFSKKQDSVRRLRHLPFLKIFLVAGVWSAVTVLLPQIENSPNQLFSMSVGFTFLTRFIFIFSITIPFDVRDMELDASMNIKTFPVVFGEKKAIKLAQICLVIFFLLYASQLINSAKWEAFKALGYMLSALSAMAFVYQSQKNKSEFFTTFWIEGLMLQQFLILFLIKQIIS